jgi:hypothetical protein
MVPSVPLGLVSDEEFEAELKKCVSVHIPYLNRSGIRNTSPFPSDPFKPTDSTPPHEHGRNPGDTNVPPIIRKLIGEAAVESREAALKVAAAFGVSPSSASAYAVGAHSTDSYHEPNPELAAALNDRRTEVITKSRSTLLAALGYITSAKMEEAGVRDLSGVAKDMAQIIAHQEPKLILQNQQSFNAKFVFHVPESRAESEFDVLDVAGTPPTELNESDGSDETE